jgi:hypothetical protein
MDCCHPRGCRVRAVLASRHTAIARRDNQLSSGEECTCGLPPSERCDDAVATNRAKKATAGQKPTTPIHKRRCNDTCTRGLKESGDYSPRFEDKPRGPRLSRRYPLTGWKRSANTAGVVRSLLGEMSGGEWRRRKVAGGRKRIGVCSKAVDQTVCRVRRWGGKTRLSLLCLLLYFLVFVLLTSVRCTSRFHV